MVSIVPQVEGKKIGNFEINLFRIVKIHTDSNSEGEPYIELSLTVEYGNSSEKTRIALSKLSDTNWISLDHRVTFDPQITVTKAKRYISNDIRSAISSFPLTDIFQLSHPGLHIINGEPVFCTGREVIRPSASATQGPKIECEQMPQRLDVDPELSEEEAAAEVLNLISLFPNPGRIILSQMLVVLMRQAYEDAGKAPSFCVFLYGASGTQKTTIASFLTQIYNRNDGITPPTRLNASQASAVEMLIGLRDQVKVFDDLFPAASNQVRRKQEETLSEITRYIGDGSIPARMKGRKVRVGCPKCGVLFTGEYLIGEGSDAARLLPVEMTKPDTAALSYFQMQPLIISTFYRYFIIWFIQNYNETVSYLEEWLEEYRKTDLGVHDRLCETHFFLNTAYSLMLNYCGEKGVLSENEIAEFHSDFLSLLSKLIHEQNNRVSPASTASPVQENVLKRIRELYNSGQLSIINDKRQFSDEQHDGVIHKEHLCLRPQALLHFFPNCNTDDIARKLDDQGALTKDKDKLKKKISVLGGKHFYWIPLASI
ncbi:MAG: hypothetical protein HDT33_08470 [Clostridiales bacterium]|nr:hypothetical protein [Clostridiales bacterium]